MCLSKSKQKISKGFYGAMLFAASIFPAVQEVIRTKVAAGGIVESAIEVFVCTLFFSGYLPVWSRIFTRIATRIVDDYWEDGVVHEVGQQRIMILLNFMMDAIRFVYGRGVLFALSSIWAFFLLLAKDTSYQFWHFGFTYFDTYVVFTMKTWVPGGKATMSPWMRGLSSFVQKYLLGVTKRHLDRYFLRSRVVGLKSKTHHDIRASVARQTEYLP